MSNTTPLSSRAPLPPHAVLAWPLAAQTAAEQINSRRARGWLAAFIAATRRSLGAAWADWRDRRAIRATRVALMNLDDQTLRDIGFVRAEINSVAAESHGGVAVTRDRLLARGTPPAF